MLYREVNAVYCENMKYINTLRWHSAVFSVKPGHIYANH